MPELVHTAVLVTPLLSLLPVEVLTPASVASAEGKLLVASEEALTVLVVMVLADVQVWLPGARNNNLVQCSERAYLYRDG